MVFAISLSSSSKIEHLRLHVSSKNVAYDGAYLFSGSPDLKTVHLNTSFTVGVSTDYVHAMFACKSLNENITVELYATQDGEENLIVSGTGRIVTLATESKAKYVVQTLP
jgi:hypothetical protein